jgi:hypothetical protein
VIVIIQNNKWTFILSQMSIRLVFSDTVKISGYTLVCRDTQFGKHWNKALINPQHATQKNELFALRVNHLYHSGNTTKFTLFVQDSCNPSGTGEFYLYGSGTFEIRQEIIDSPGSSPLWRNFSNIFFSSPYHTINLSWKNHGDAPCGSLRNRKNLNPL